ncbi:hypothetical protein [Cohaesibacter gelatinilyticus]|uniref:Restriction endonuclease n=1 Tax=Cohaesibacter gelatinilyticus TaxID=372072 RepID=A0A285PCN6_9HYPH|nr:hypothetical protein [Cohaesibacter gelatinilyticus]SNZ19510.1 hypothetical protein SAMN06265368_2599 [Cohaesibacter gelatinilyticus]
MTDKKSTGRQLGFEAEEFAASLFEALGYVVTREVLIGGIMVDMIIERDGLWHPVEVKFFLKRVSNSTILENAVRLRQLVSVDPRLSNPILVIIGSLTAYARGWSSSNFDIRVWDYQELRNKTVELKELRQRLDMLIDPENMNTQDINTASREKREVVASSLIERLRSHEAKDGLTPTDYEKLCREVFSFLFDPFLFGFSDQHRTTDGANRFDFVCRIKSGDQFWDALQRDFRTRVILFECKNYKDKITADQIYSTERYLFTSALRTVAFLISRKGHDEGCFRAAQGAMRESGKLIILLSNKELIEMLKFEGTEDGATSFLDQHIWRFVTGLPR